MSIDQECDNKFVLLDYIGRKQDLEAAWSYENEETHDNVFETYAWPAAYFRSSFTKLIAEFTVKR